MNWETRVAMLTAAGCVMLSQPASATLVSVTSCTRACTITDTPPNPVVPNPNDGLTLWNERQNVTLVEALAVDRVFDPSASFVSGSDGNFMLAAGTVVSSHYVQFDPEGGAFARIEATITADSQIFAFITEDQKLFDSDAVLGLPGLDYNDFFMRGLELSDETDFNGTSVDIFWNAQNPGDWARLITAYSPTAASVPAPPALPLLAAGLAAMGLTARARARRGRAQAGV